MKQLLKITACLAIASCRGNTRPDGGNAPPPPTNNVQIQKVQDPPQLVGKPLFIFMDGWGTCKGMTNKGMSGAFARAQTVATKYGSEYILSCYDNLNVLHVFTSKAPSVAAVSGPENIVDLVRTELNLKANALPPVLVGHSYGGWTAMKTVLDLKDNFKFGSLITSDPISRLNCPPERFVEQVVSLDPDANCKTSPQDLANATIKQAVPDWINLYQTQYKYLHSAEIADAKQNILVKMPFSINPINYHSKLDVNDNLWNSVEAELQRLQP